LWFSESLFYFGFELRGVDPKLVEDKKRSDDISFNPLVKPKLIELNLNERK